MKTFNFRNHAPIQLFPFLMVLHAHSEQVYVTGGAVRDLLSGKEPNDWDLVTDIPMGKLISIFEEGGFEVSQTGVVHLVLNISLAGFIVEISNFRKDKVCDGRHAEVEIGTIVDDAHRRDFTINALYINTKTNEVVDPTGQGLGDLKEGILRFVGRPKDRIREDFLRCHRFYRFAARGFKPDVKSLRAVREMFNEASAHVAPERVRVELEKMARID